MHGRNLTGSNANVFDLDVFIRDNRHSYDAFIYGFAQQKSLSAKIAMTFAATIEMKLLFYLRSFEIKNGLSFDNLLLSVDKYIRANIPMTVSSIWDYALIKHIRGEILNHIHASIKVHLLKAISANGIPNTLGFKNLLIGLLKFLDPVDIPFGFQVGSFDLGRFMSEFQDLYLSDIENLTLEMWSAPLTSSKYGLKIHLDKFIRTEILNVLETRIDYVLIKQMRQELLNCLEVQIDVGVKKILQFQDIKLDLIIGTIDRGRRIADIEDYFISDVEDLTIEELCEGVIGTRRGLKMGVVKALFIADIQDLTIAEIQNRTIEELTIIRID